MVPALQTAGSYIGAIPTPLGTAAAEAAASAAAPIRDGSSSDVLSHAYPSQVGQ